MVLWAYKTVHNATFREFIVKVQEKPQKYQTFIEQAESSKIPCVS